MVPQHVEIRDQVWPEPTVPDLTVLCPQGRPEMKEAPPECSPVKRGQLRAVITVGATDAAGAVVPGKSAEVLGKQMVQGPYWTDLLCFQATPGIHRHLQEAPRSPSTQRRSGHSSFTFNSSESLADSWSQDTEKQPRGCGEQLPSWWANGRKWMDGGVLSS